LGIGEVKIVIFQRKFSILLSLIFLLFINYFNFSSRAIRLCLVYAWFRSIKQVLRQILIWFQTRLLPVSSSLQLFDAINSQFKVFAYLLV